MNNELIENLMKQASKLAKEVEFIWHGGEPLLAGATTFNEVIRIQKQISLEAGTRFRNRLQTNATLINGDWIEVFKKGNFRLGVSLDGTQRIHDENRKNKNKKGSFLKVMSGIKTLQDSQIDFAVLAVLSKKSIGFPDEIFNFFCEQKFTRFDFLPLVEVDNMGQKTEDSLNVGDFSDFMIKIFDLWISRDDDNISIRYLEQILSTMLGNKPSLCKLSGNCQDYITIDYNGNVFPCDNFIGYDELKYGNLQTSTLSQILKKKKTIEIKNALSQTHNECNECFAFQFCNSGCNKYRYMWNKDFKSPFYMCEDTKNIVGHIQKYLNSEHPLLFNTVSLV